MIDLTKAVEPGYQEIFAISEVEAAMRTSRIKRTKTVCTYCGVGCSFEVWTKGPTDPEDRTAMGGACQRHLHLREGQVGLGVRQQRRAPDQAPDPSGRHVCREHMG